MIINPHIKSEYYWSDKQAKLYSHRITGSVCMKFFFYLYGNETGHLKISVRHADYNYEHVVFHRYGNHGHKWNFGQVYLNSAPTVVYQVPRTLIHLIKMRSIY